MSKNPDINDDALMLRLDSFEGPLDLLLNLIKDRKLDISAISILSVIDQYIEWVEKSEDFRIELAADWLVMMSTLTFLKSKLLLPLSQTEKISVEQVMEDLATKLKRRDAIRTVALEISSRPQIGQHVFMFGDCLDEEQGISKRLDANLHALLVAYAREARVTLAPSRSPVQKPYKTLSIEDAQIYLEKNEKLTMEFTPLMELLPVLKIIDMIHQRSVISSTYVASLELSKQGKLCVENDESFVKVKRW